MAGSSNGDRAQAFSPLALHGRRRHESGTEPGAREPHHQRVIDDLERRLRAAKGAVDDGPDAPARREAQDHLFPEIGDADAVPAGERVVRAAHEHHRLAPQVVQDDAARQVADVTVAAAGAQRDVHRAVADRLQVARGAR
jgi:hypothetical protein